MRMGSHLVVEKEEVHGVFQWSILSKISNFRLGKFIFVMIHREFIRLVTE